jgi:hypothetical protein
MEYLRQVLAEANKAASGDTSEVPYKTMEKVKKLIKKGAMDPDHHWGSAMELTDVAYEAENVQKPLPSMKAAWTQYEDALLFTVQMLSKATQKGVRDDGWKLLSSKLEDQASGKQGGFRQKFGI